VRTARLAARERTDPAIADSRTLVFTPQVP